MNSDLGEMAKEIIKQRLVEWYQDMDFVSVANDDPDARDLLDEDFDKLVDLMTRVKANITTTL